MGCKLAKPKATVVTPSNNSPDTSIRFNVNDRNDVIQPITREESIGYLVDGSMSPALNELHGSYLALVNSNASTTVLPDESVLNVPRVSIDTNAISGIYVYKSTCTRMQRLISEMKESIVTLNKQSSSHDSNYDDIKSYTDLEDWACIIYESMSGSSRTFHSVQHVFDISEGAGPILKLAVFFHDVIYYSIDDGLPNDRVQELIGNVFIDNNGKVTITEDKLDTNTNMVMDIFGFKPGQMLDPFKGMNEFLSAVVAIRCYQNLLTNAHLAQIAACIEATVPFRKVNNEGKCPCDLLYDRLVKVNEKYNLELNEAQLVESVKYAVELGNRDLDNFSISEHTVFLSNTWNLLPESNICLRNTKVFRISDYALALKKMTGFFKFLDPNTIFMSFRDDDEQKFIIKEKTRMAAVNIQIATKYMICKLLSIGVLAAISELSGGDAPLALFLGDLPERNYVSITIEDYIDTPSGPINDTIIIDKNVFDLLSNGRDSESKFDIKNSPLAAYLYSLIGDEGVEKCSVYAVCPMDEVNAKSLLRSIPKIASATIVAACAELATTRTGRFDQMMIDLFGQE